MIEDSLCRLDSHNRLLDETLLHRSKTHPPPTTWSQGTQRSYGLPCRTPAVHRRQPLLSHTSHSKSANNSMEPTRPAAAKRV